MSKFNRILFCGGREFKDYDFLAKYLDYKSADFSGTAVIIHGAAKGADRLGGQWALARGYEVEVYPAEWENLEQPGATIRTRPNGRQYNANAGFFRNQQMLDSGPDLVIAFEGGNGTNHMIDISHKAGIKVIKVKKKT